MLRCAVSSSCHVMFVLSLTQIPAGAIAAALQRIEADSDSDDDGDGGFTEAGSMWGGDEVRLKGGGGRAVLCCVAVLLGDRMCRGQAGHEHFVGGGAAGSSRTSCGVEGLQIVCSCLPMCTHPFPHPTRRRLYYLLQSTSHTHTLPLCILHTQTNNHTATPSTPRSSQVDDDVSPEDAAALAAFMSPAALDGSGAAAQRTLADAIMAKINSSTAAAAAQQQQDGGMDVQQQQDAGCVCLIHTGWFGRAWVCWRYN